MKRLLFLVILAMTLSCDAPVVEDTFCYKCLTVIVTDFCAEEGGIDEVRMRDDPVFCDYTEEEIKCYEDKGSFTIEEKCFYRVQITKCYLWHE